MSELLHLRGLTVELPMAARRVRPLADVSLQIAAGECLGLVGEPARCVLERPEGGYTKELLAAVPEIPQPCQV